MKGAQKSLYLWSGALVSVIAILALVIFSETLIRIYIEWRFCAPYERRQSLRDFEGASHKGGVFIHEPGDGSTIQFVAAKTFEFVEFHTYDQRWSERDIVALNIRRGALYRVSITTVADAVNCVSFKIPSPRPSSFSISREPPHGSCIDIREVKKLESSYAKIWRREEITLSMGRVRISETAIVTRPDNLVVASMHWVDWISFLPLARLYTRLFDITGTSRHTTELCE